MKMPLYRCSTQSEIIKLAADEGHDADIPTNAGSTHQTASHTPVLIEEKKLSDLAMKKDIENEDIGHVPLSSNDETEAEQVIHDPNIVWWDGPDDPENPLNWPFLKKWGAVTLVSAITFLTPLASSMFAPGVPDIMREFDSTDDMLGGFMVSVYVLGFAFGPLIIAPLSEMYGRLVLYHTCNWVFVVFSIAAAVSSNMGMFIVFRFFMGCFGGAPAVLGGGTIADLIVREQRGTAMSVWLMGPTIGPCVGPIIGGFLTQARGWRWNFWFVAIVGGAIALISLALMRETSASVILKRKTERLRKETGNLKLRSKLDTGLSPKQLFMLSIVRPAKMLTRSTICFSISLYIAITYSYLYILFTTFTSVFSKQYGWSGGIVGLSFLGLGLGSVLGQFVFTHWGNKTAAKHISLGDFRPEHRLYIMAYGGPLLPIGLFVYGWSIQAQTHYMVPLVGTALIGFGLLMVFMPASTYLVDAFTVHAASAMAASTVLRSLMGALIPLSSEKMYAVMGYGWGNSLLGFVGFAMVPIPFLFIRYGEKIRVSSKIDL